MQLRRYVRNSPEAMARVLAMMVVTDGKVDPEEVGQIDALHCCALLHMEMPQFMRVLHDYCEDLIASGRDAGHIRLLDRARIDEVADAVDDHDARVLLAGMLINLCAVDGTFRDKELAVFHRVLERWDLSLAQLDAELQSARHHLRRSGERAPALSA